MSGPNHGSPASMEHDVPLAPLTTLGVGGTARILVRATTEAEVVRQVRQTRAAGEPLYVLGGGSNLVIGEGVLRGRVLAVRTRGWTFSETGRSVDGHPEVRVTAAAGESWDRLVAETVARSLCGLECLSGIPGAVGATPIQNVGAYGQEVSQVLEAVRVHDQERDTIRHLPAEACGFRYRSSRFRHLDPGRFTILGVTFRLRQGPPAPPRYPALARALETTGLPPDAAGVRRVVLALRRRRGMVYDPADPHTRSAGSFFVNPVVPVTTWEAVRDRARSLGLVGANDSPPRFPAEDASEAVSPLGGPAPARCKIPAAWLVEQSGFPRGFCHGRTGLSPHHALALVNRGGASAGDVVDLARRIRAAVHRRWGIVLEPEPVFWGFPHPPLGSL